MCSGDPVELIYKGPSWDCVPGDKDLVDVVFLSLSLVPLSLPVDLYKGSSWDCGPRTGT